MCRLRDHAPDPRDRIRLGGHKGTQVATQAIIRIPGQQVIGDLILSVDVQIRALLLDDEYLAAQAQELIKLACRELSKAAPVVALG